MQVPAKATAAGGRKSSRKVDTVADRELAAKLQILRQAVELCKTPPKAAEPANVESARAHQRGAAVLTPSNSPANRKRGRVADDLDQRPYKTSRTTIADVENVADSDAALLLGLKKEQKFTADCVGREVIKGATIRTARESCTAVAEVGNGKGRTGKGKGKERARGVVGLGEKVAGDEASGSGTSKKRS